jgi:hypothetical protein
MSKEYETIEKEELGAWGIYALDYFLEVLRGEKTELIERINKIKTAIEKHNKELEDIQKDLKGE